MSNPTEPAVKEQLFWKLAQALITSSRAERSTMMGFPCLRVDGRFFASLERGSSNLIVKLPAERVRELVASETGVPFAPNGRVFREWVAVEGADEGEWAELVEEAWTFARRHS